jgi:hypothetical protein
MKRLVREVVARPLWRRSLARFFASPRAHTRAGRRWPTPNSFFSTRHSVDSRGTRAMNSSPYALIKRGKPVRARPSAITVL